MQIRLVVVMALSLTGLQSVIGCYYQRVEPDYREKYRVAKASGGLITDTATIRLIVAAAETAFEPAHKAEYQLSRQVASDSVYYFVGFWKPATTVDESLQLSPFDSGVIVIERGSMRVASCLFTAD